MSELEAPKEQGSVSAPAVLLAVFLIATCGLVYELMAGTLASYVLGDSVTQFSTVIGVYLSALGLGAWLSRYVEKNIVLTFIEVEIAVALIGGGSAALLFLAFARLSFFRLVLYLVVLLIGTLVGLEIPLLMRILKDRYELKDLISRVLTVDYLGALVASLVFPLFLVPKLGLIRGAFATGLLNAAVALWSSFLFVELLPRKGLGRLLRAEALLAMLMLLAGIVASDKLTSLAEEDLYSDEIVFARSSAYQRIVLTRGKSGFQLFLNGNLQFSSVDEHRYHEALVHPAMSVLGERGPSGPGRNKVLVLGGGDGMAVRELLRYPELESVTLVDLDPAMTALGAEHPLVRAQNKDAFHDPRVHIVHQDAMIWLEERSRSGAPGEFSAVFVDFPDPNNFSLGKLYTTRFYGLAQKALRPGGMMTVQATSPFLARRSFWCVVETIEASGFFARAYHTHVPAFGEWGFVLAAKEPFPVPRALLEPTAAPLKYLDSDTMAGMFVFGRDMARVPAEVNRLNNQVLVQYYEEEWARFY